MGSRLRENPSRFIECWCEVVAPQGKDRPPWIIQKFPRTYEEEEVLKSVPQFTFPCAFEKSAVQHFSFVLTNIESKFLYGFCRHAPDYETSIVILSHLPWHELFYKLLNHCSSLISNENSGDLWSFLQSLCQVSVPAPGTKLSITYGDKKFEAECPNHLNLPSIPENRNLSEYFSAVDVESMMVVFASMLNERRIIFTSEKVSRLSACVQAANNLIYPMSWQHIFIPVLPEHLIDYLNAPMPFLIGIAWPLMQKVNVDEIGEVVILNADTNTVTSPFNDLLNLPEEVISSLRKSLNPSNNHLGDSVARSFLKALVHLIGNYREALQFREEDRKITFCEEKFVNQRPSHFQPFVQKMLELQIFRQFIEERVDLLNSGLHTSDEFELEAIVFGERSSSKMKQIISNVKKESGAIMKNVKNKTNPAMKSAVKSVAKGGKNVREKSKITYKGIKGKFKDMQQSVPKAIESSRDSSYVNGESITKPRSAPSSPTQSHRRLNKKSVSGIYESYSAKVSYKRASQPYVPKNVAVDDHRVLKQLSEDSQKTPSPQEIDLMGEMEDALNSQLIFMRSDLSPNKLSSLSSLNSTAQQETISNFSLSSSVVSSNDPNFNSSIVSTGNSNPFEREQLNNLSPMDSNNIFEGHSLENSKNRSTQDLLFLESPSEEVVDPFITKPISPPIPSRHNKTSHTGSAGPEIINDVSLDAHYSSSSSLTSSNSPRKLSPTRYLPFKTLQNYSSNTPNAVQNPLYNSHHPSLIRPMQVPPPPPPSRIGNPFLVDSNDQMVSQRNKNPVTRACDVQEINNPAVAFAASMLITSNPQSNNSVSSQNFTRNPFLNGSLRDQNRPIQKLTDKDLLGDFSSDFLKLSVSRKDKNSNL